VQPSSEEEDGDGLAPPALLDEMTLFEWAGVGLSREEGFRVYMSLCKLQLSKKLATVRFFGKILGTSKDYYLAEAKHVDPPEQPEPDPDAPAPAVPPEEYGTGCNSCSYFVTNDPAAPWVELPNVTPRAIAAASLVRKFFTGDLSADVRCYPPFPGLEKDYLRAQIARLVHGTTLCPNGKYCVNEEGEVEEVPKDEEGYVPLSNGAMGEPASWCHFYKGILGIGRTTNLPVEEEEVEEGEEPKPKGPELEPEKAALLPIAGADWSVFGPKHIGSGAAVAVARCLVWPGAYAAAEMKEDRFANLYIGWGHPAMDGVNVQPPPPPIMADDDELTEAEDVPLEQENQAFRAAAEKALAEGVDE
jgi:radial spoke head protein 4A